MAEDTEPRREQLAPHHPLAFVALPPVQPSDMFPQTYHIETVAALEWPLG